MPARPVRCGLAADPALRSEPVDRPACVAGDGIAVVLARRADLTPARALALVGCAEGVVRLARHPCVPLDVPARSA
ncbi:hypothetical protein ACFW2Y_31050 [Streptomyces sp. NPDC058877]|uniref:hypothetical protein n=1 Tax=Streptomyces sp. NPDC058877 TaxID=3346665 RepID=UPI0036A41B7C